MSLRRASELDRLRLRLGKGPAVFVESGTFHGKTTRWAVERFREVHTIELSPELAANARRDLAALGVHCHEGDTRDVLPLLAESIAEPVCWFLDAHWAGCR
jgi:predicted O-methyltransferase YrrM